MINPLVTTNSIDLIFLDHPELDIKKPEYGYDSDVRERVNWRLAKRILKSVEFPLLISLKGVDHMLTAEEVLKSETDEDFMFRDLDNAGIISPLGPPILVPQRDPTPTPQAPQESEFPPLQDLPKTDNII